MFTLVAAVLFFSAFALAMGTIAWMLLTYHDKMVAALTFEPIPQDLPVYHIRIARPRAHRTTTRVAMPTRQAALAV